MASDLINQAFKMSFTYSVYIPRVFKGVSQDQIRGTFYGQSIGKVGRVDLLKVYNEKDQWVYNKAFVHFEEWFANNTSLQLKDDIESGLGGAKLNYDGERFWMLLPNASDSVPDEEQNNTVVQEMMTPRAHPMIINQNLHQHPFQPIMPPHVLMNPYGYMAPPPVDIGDRNRYYTNYTAAHHEYFTNPQFYASQCPINMMQPRLGAQYPTK